MQLTAITALILMACALPGRTQAAYNLTIEVFESRVDEECGVAQGQTSCRPTQVIDVHLAGRTLTLQGKTLVPKGLIALGAYRARLIEQSEKPTKEFTASYELQFADGTTRKFSVIGVRKGFE